MWPAFWLLGDNITVDPWPACGELDVMEHIDGANRLSAAAVQATTGCSLQFTEPASIMATPTTPQAFPPPPGTPTA